MLWDHLRKCLKICRLDTEPQLGPKTRPFANSSPLQSNHILHLTNWNIWIFIKIIRSYTWQQTAAAFAKSFRGSLENTWIVLIVFLYFVALKYFCERPFCKIHLLQFAAPPQEIYLFQEIYLLQHLLRKVFYEGFCHSRPCVAVEAPLPRVQTTDHQIVQDTLLHCDTALQEVLRVHHL